MNKLYKNRDWLNNQYWNLNKSAHQIATELNINEDVVLYWLKKLNIKRRSLSEAAYFRQSNYVDLSFKAIEFIEGELLGDGHLEIQSKYSARYSHGSKYKEYVEWLSEMFNSFGVKQTGKIYQNFNKERLLDGHFFSGSWAYNYASLSYPELLTLWKRWYRPSTSKDAKQWKHLYKYIKIVPRDIELTPLVCRQWYIGDGSLSHYKRGKSRDTIKLSTKGFLVEDIDFLVIELKKLGFKATRQLSDNNIYISTESTPAFLKYIGDCPIDCYRYKWELK